MGVASRGYVEGIRQDLDKRLGSLESRQAAHSDSATGWAGPKTIERLGVRFDLVDSIVSYLGKTDPIHVDNLVIDNLLQGPFCRKCRHTLSYWNKRMSSYVVQESCPSCELPWQQPTGCNIYSLKWKEQIYRSLDAEFRRTGKLASSDKQP